MGCGFYGIKKDLHDTIRDWSSCDVDFYIAEETTLDGSVSREFLDYRDNVSETLEPLLVVDMLLEHILAKEGELPLAVTIDNEIGCLKFSDDVVKRRPGDPDFVDEVPFLPRLIEKSAEAFISFQKGIGEV
jgi:hypothetical protein|nr:hypothetical protein [Halorubrum tropicale]